MTTPSTPSMTSPTATPATAAASMPASPLAASSHFHALRVSHISPESAGSVAITLQIPDDLLARFEFQPGQYLTLRSKIDGADVRRSYSICCTHSHLRTQHALVVGIRPMEGGVFSNWAAQQLRVGDTLLAMAPQGRFVSKRPRALHRVAFAAGSGITPILSIMASSLEDQAESKFTLVYGNRNMHSVMFNEALQDLKDRYTNRLTLIHIFSRQAQEVDLLEGRIDADKVRALTASLLPVASMDEVFICGPEAMIETTEQALRQAGLDAAQIHTERFTSPLLESLPPEARQTAVANHKHAANQGASSQAIPLTVVLDGKSHALHIRPEQYVLDVALAAGLDLPYSCKGGVCCTCRAKVLQGQASMDKNFSLEPWETAQGFVLSCQARCTGQALTISYDER